MKSPISRKAADEAWEEWKIHQGEKVKLQGFITWLVTLAFVTAGIVVLDLPFIPSRQVEKPATLSPPPQEAEPVVFGHRYGHGELKVFELNGIGGFRNACFLAVYERRGKVEGSAEIELDEPEISFSLACQ